VGVEFDVLEWDVPVSYKAIVDGFTNLPRALIGLLSGENIGKMLVKIGPDA